MARACLCVFAKRPRPGRVKTRLVPAVGEAGAARLAEAFVADSLAALERRPEPVVLATVGPWPEQSAQRTLWEQGPGDLGARLERVLRRALEHAPIAVALGADSPGLPAAHLDACLAGLEEAEALLGPTEDGGFYALALRRCPPGCLAGLPWSQPHTARATAQQLAELGLRVGWGPAWWDVDEPADLGRLWQLPPARIPQTRAVLADLLPRAAGPAPEDPG